MGLLASYQKHTLYFKFEAGTSRGVLTQKDSYYIKIHNDQHPDVYGIGECSPIKGLSIDDRPDFEDHLDRFCQFFSRLNTNQHTWNTDTVLKDLITNEFPAIQFGFESALLDLMWGGKRVIFKNDFVKGKKAIDINGLIWMGDKDFMLKQIDEKIREGYRCIKLKIGSIDFEQECDLLAYIRKQYSSGRITLRVDANGAFDPYDAPKKLKRLSEYDIHSIEQPIKPYQSEMIELCHTTPLPIALDEELIGISQYVDKVKLLQDIQPQFIILKPSLLGGFTHCKEWIDIAEEMQMGWWVTSALESNIGLNAISQFVAGFNNPMTQGLGTGKIFTNNIDSPLEIHDGKLFYRPDKPWDLSIFGLDRRNSG